jgi:hypothetical protein
VIACLPVLTAWNFNSRVPVAPNEQLFDGVSFSENLSSPSEHVTDQVYPVFGFSFNVTLYISPLWIVVSFAVLEAVTGTQSINISNKRHIIFIEFLISFTPLYILTIKDIKIFNTLNIVLKVYSISYSRLT